MSGARVGRLVVALVLMVTAVLKFVHFVLWKDWTLLTPIFTHPFVLHGLIVVELLLGVALLTRRYASAACWSVLGLVIVSNAVLAYVRYVHGEGIECGCLGSIPISYGEHVAFSACLFGLAICGLSDRAGTRWEMAKKR